MVFGSNLIFPDEQKVDFENLILGFISWNKSRSCFSFWIKLQISKNSGFLLIVVLSAGLLGFLEVFAGNLLESLGNTRLELFQLDRTLLPYLLKS